MKIFNKNGLPYSMRVLFTPGVVIFESWFSLHKEKTRIQKNRLNQGKSVK